MKIINSDNTTGKTADINDVVYRYEWGDDIHFVSPPKYNI